MMHRLMPAAAYAIALAVLAACADLGTLPEAPAEARGTTSAATVSAPLPGSPGELRGEEMFTRPQPSLFKVAPVGGGEVTSLNGGPGDNPPPITCGTGWSPWFNPANEVWYCRNDESGQLGGGVG